MQLRKSANWLNDAKQHSFKFDQAPNESTISFWSQPETRASLLHKLVTECFHVIGQTSIYPVRFLEFQTTLVDCVHAMEDKKVVLNDELLRKQALKFAKEMNLNDFTASKCWLESVKKTAQIKRIMFHGEAGSADSINAAISQSTCSLFFQNVRCATEQKSLGAAGQFRGKSGFSASHGRIPSTTP